MKLAALLASAILIATSARCEPIRGSLGRADHGLPGGATSGLFARTEEPVAAAASGIAEAPSEEQQLPGVGVPPVYHSEPGDSRLARPQVQWRSPVESTTKQDERHQIEAAQRCPPGKSWKADGCHFDD